MFNKIKESFRISPQQIALSGMLVAIGIVSEAFIRVNHYTFLTFGIYAAIALLLPLWLSITSVMLVDLLQLTIRGVLGSWFWTLQLEPVIFVILIWIAKLFINKIKSPKLIFLITISIIFAIFTSFIIISAIDYEQLVPINQAKESDEDMVGRLIQKYSSIIGVIALTVWVALNAIKFKKGETNKNPIMFLIIAIAIVLNDWIYHPWSVNEWRYRVLEIDKTTTLYRLSVIKGVWLSIFHISISIPIVFTFEMINKNIKNHNAY